MTAFEYFKKQYDENHEEMVERIRKDIPIDSFHFVEVASKCCFGGTTDVDAWFNIKGVEDMKEMFEQKFLDKWDGYDRKRHVTLTKKGLRAFYKSQF